MYSAKEVWEIARVVDGINVDQMRATVRSIRRDPAKAKETWKATTMWKEGKLRADTDSGPLCLRLCECARAERKSYTQTLDSTPFAKKSAASANGEVLPPDTG